MYLQTQLAREFPTAIRSKGEELYRYARVTLISGDRWEVSAVVQDSRVYRVGLSREGDKVQAICDCPFFDSEIVCRHIWATIVAADKKSYLLGAMGGGRLELVDPFADDDIEGLNDEDEDDDDDEDDKKLDFPPKNYSAYRRPEPPPPPKPKIPQWRALLQQVKDAPLPGATTEAWRVDREIYYILDRESTISSRVMCLKIENRDRLQNGAWGKLKALRASRSILREIPDPLDREILTALCGASQPYTYYDEAIPAVCHLKQAAQDILLPKICATGRFFLLMDSSVPLETLEPLQWDDGSPWELRLIVEPGGPHWILRGVLQRGDDRMELNEPAMLLDGGVVIARNRVAPLNDHGAFSWIAMLRKEGRLQIPAAQGPELVAEILQAAHVPEIDWPDELRVEEVTAVPRPHLKFSQSNGWSKTAMRGRLLFDYAGVTIPYEGHPRGLYQPQVKRYFRRDAVAERSAIQTLADLGLKEGQAYYGETGKRWDVAPKKLPAVVRELVKAGWHVEAEGKTFRRSSGMRTEFTSGVDWFELHGAVEYDGVEVKLPELLKAIDRGDQLVSLGDGSFGILPEDFLEKYGLLARLGRSQGDHVRFTASQAGMLDVLLAARPEIPVDEIFTKAREELRCFEGIEAAAQPENFVGQLRGYQCEGLAWMYFLQRVGFGGCLADDMGVGKTPQVLALLETRRQLRMQNGKSIGPSLGVAPRSLIYNWRQEAARFTPLLRVLDHTRTC